MKILVLNGSPKAKNSNTLRITSAFLGGINSCAHNHVDLVNINDCEIGHCGGCYACWTKTPGLCVLDDDMAALIKKYMRADLIIWSFPLYCFGMPSKIKAFVDRLLPTNLPEMIVNTDGTSGHPARYDISNQRHMLISTCGFHSVKGNYEGLLQQFEIMFGDKLSKIICPEGELLRVPELSARVDAYLAYVKTAGEEYDRQGSFSEKTQARLNELLYPPEAFMEMANASWEIEEMRGAAAPEEGADKDISHPFLRQMAATYNANFYSGDIVLEMHFTDLGKTYQLLLGKEKCVVKTEHFIPYTTRIETPFSLWLEISEGKRDGAEAMMQRQYQVLGDFDTMIKLDDYFGAKKPAAPAPDKVQNSNMLLLLLPFLAMWLVMPFDLLLGAAAGILASGLVTVLHFWLKPTPYERAGAFAVIIIGLFVLMTGGAAWQMSLPAFASGMLWLTSSFLKIPVTAHYSCKEYGGEQAFTMPLFIQTNRILTTLWGIAYLLWGAAELFTAGMPGSLAAEIAIWVITALLGVFTGWFSKWYPAKVAKG